jgi:hypothetical protein
MRPSRFLTRFWLIGALLTGMILISPSATAQEGDSSAKTQTQPFSLRNARAAEMAAVLRTLFADKVNDKARIAIGVDERTNQLIISASQPILAEVAKVLQTLDVPGAPALQGGRPLNLYRMRHLQLDRKLEEALRMLIPNPSAGHFVLDPSRKLVIVHGTPLVQDLVEAFLSRLDTEAPDAPPRPLQVRILWLVGGKAAKGDGVVPAGAFPTLASDLAKLGVNPMRLAAQTLVQVMPGSSFAVSGGAALDVPCTLKVSGKVSAAEGGAVSLAGTASVLQGEKGAPVRLCDLQTELRVPLGKLVVMGSAPVRGDPTAFVVEVVEAGVGQLPEKKAAGGADSGRAP